MEITNDIIDRLAELAKLRFEQDEKEALKGDLQKILKFVEQLNELDTDGVEPLIHMSEELNRLRADEVKGMLSQEKALGNAPLKDSDYFKVPKVID